jgi:hypothetical protein
MLMENLTKFEFKSKTAYLIVTQRIVTQTQVPSMVEDVNVCTNIKTHNLQEGWVILDLKHGKVIKNRMADTKDKVYNYYTDKYATEIKQLQAEVNK